VELVKTEIGIEDTDKIEVKFEPGEKYGTIKFYDSLHVSLELEMHRKQAERLIQAIESELYDEVSKDIINRLETKIARLELELEDAKDKIEYMEGYKWQLKKETYTWI